MTFNLTIELGNEAMETGRDVRAAIEQVARDVDTVFALNDSDRGRIRDENGNTVGFWKVME